ncbi:RIP metalloprotease RseP [Bacillaceae bacterium]
MPTMDTLENILAMILVFGALVFFHELGHFLLARRAGILCREFALGMGPKLLSFKKGETTYTLRAFPIGGFVRMAGEDPEIVEVKRGQKVGLSFDDKGRVVKIVLNRKNDFPDLFLATVEQVDLEEKLTIRVVDDNGEEHAWPVHPQAKLVYDRQEIQIAPKDRQFAGKTLGQRFWTLFAGPAANFLLAAVLLIIFGLAYGVPVYEAKLGNVLPGSPAEAAGLQAGDRIVAIEGKKVESWEDLVRIVSQSPGKPLTFVVERNGGQYTTTVTPNKEGNTGKIGVEAPPPRIDRSVIGAFAYGIETTYDFSVLIFKSIGMLLTGQVSLQELSGPVGIYKMTGEAAQQGLAILLKWSAVLSINLGIFNLLPLPALDGGRLVFLGIEAVRGKPIDPQKEGMVHFLGFAFLMLLILVVTWNDIQRFFL